MITLNINAEISKWRCLVQTIKYHVCCGEYPLLKFYLSSTAQYVTGQPKRITQSVYREVF